jgi:hypothetical protein
MDPAKDGVLGAQVTQIAPPQFELSLGVRRGGRAPAFCTESLDKIARQFLVCLYSSAFLRFHGSWLIDIKGRDQRWSVLRSVGIYQRR